MTIDTRMSVANIILDFTTGLPERKPSQPHILLTATRETQEQLPQGWSTLQIRVFKDHKLIQPGAECPAILQHDMDFKYYVL
jgi:hypothetical protein